MSTVRKCSLFSFRVNLSLDPSSDCI